MAIVIWMMIVAAIALAATLHQADSKLEKWAVSLVCIAGLTAGAMIVLGIIP